MTNPIPAVQHAGLYRPETGRATTCKHANNPECVCGWRRAAQEVPYYPESPHEEVWPVDGG